MVSAMTVANAVATSSSSIASGAHSHWQDNSTRERIAGSPLVPDCVKWAEDGRVAIVTDASIMISTFMSRELEMYLQHSPAISKSFIFLPETSTDQEHVPLPTPVFNEPTRNMTAGATAYFLLNETERHQHNPKELSMSKNDGKAFVAVTWGPRGSGPNASCAIMALTSSGRISLHFSSSFHMSWQEVEVISERLYEFFDGIDFQLPPTADDSSSSSKKRKSPDGTMSIAEYTQACSLLSTLSIAWSPFVTSKRESFAASSAMQSLVAVSGRKATTIWSYGYPTFNGSDHPSNQPSYLSSRPLAWIDTQAHGWVSTSTWKQLHRSCYQNLDDLQLAMGTTSGNVLLATMPLSDNHDEDMAQLPLDRVITAPYHQPVTGLCLGSANTFGNTNQLHLMVASGSTISVWNINKKRPQPKQWKAHEGNITGLAVNYYGDLVFSSSVDGQVKAWNTTSGDEVVFGSGLDQRDTTSTTTASVASKYPLFGLCVSPNSAQVACVHIIPPAARPNRKSQADVSYSRVSCALEYLPSPYARDSATFIQTMIDILEQNGTASMFMDVLWFCHEDNQAITSLHGSSDMTIPKLLNKLKGVSGTDQHHSISRQPLYLGLCEELESRYYQSSASSSFPLLLQASYLLRSSIVPAENHIPIQQTALTRIRKSVYTYWAEKCLHELLASTSQVDNLAALSPTECSSALMMADFLSVQGPLSATSERLVTTIYHRLGSDDNNANWSKFLQARAQTPTNDDQVTRTQAPMPPPRQTCYICDHPVPFSELDVQCVAGHALDRCFLSFRIISSLDTWKCLGCGALAAEIDFSRGVSPFYLLEDSEKKTSSSHGVQVTCRLCGNYCSFFKY